MNLYQKYKPRTLDDVIGHEKIIGELRKRSVEGNFPQCILLSGMTGIGKTTIGHIIAKTILCEKRDEKGNPCNTCEFCKMINEERGISGYYEFNASNLGIDDMRMIQEVAIKKSAFSKSDTKVIYIDELQELVKSKPAMKNLLKILEKPMKNRYFILGTMDEKKVDKAIKNRCVKYRLFPVDEVEIASLLYSICEKEEVPQIHKDVNKVYAILSLVAYYSKGSIRTAISYLERIIYSDIWTEEGLEKELGILSEDTIVNIVNGILKGSVEGINLFEITEDILYEIKIRLILIYQKLSGVKLSKWQMSGLKGLVDVKDISKVSSILSQLFELQKYPYLTKYQIVFTVMSIINQMSGKVDVLTNEVKKEKPVALNGRRRLNER